MTSPSPALILKPELHRLADRAALRLERMQRAPHYSNGRFRNAGANMDMDAGRAAAMMREYLNARGVQRKPPSALPLVSPLAAWSEAPRTGLRATWLGHSTTLLEIDGARVLTDPVWALRASPVQALGPRRFHPPPVALEQLPALDAILVSHDHYDHLDADAVATLARTTQAPFVTALGVGAHLERFGVPHERIIELDWWEAAEIPRTGLTVTAAPAQHFSGRGVGDRNRTLWGSYVFSSPRRRVFFSGDGGLEPEFGRIGRELGPFDLILLEVGAYNPTWKEIHLGPWQALEAHRMLGGAPLLPVHWGTFDLALHAWDEPVQVLEEEAQATRLPLLAPRLGQAVDVEHEEDVRRKAHRIDAWWREVR